MSLAEKTEEWEVLVLEMKMTGLLAIGDQVLDLLNSLLREVMEVMTSDHRIVKVNLKALLCLTSQLHGEVIHDLLIMHQIKHHINEIKDLEETVTLKRLQEEDIIRITLNSLEVMVSFRLEVRIMTDKVLIEVTLTMQVVMKAEVITTNSLLDTEINREIDMEVTGKTDIKLRTTLVEQILERM